MLRQRIFGIFLMTVTLLISAAGARAQSGAWSWAARNRSAGAQAAQPSGNPESAAEPAARPDSQVIQQCDLACLLERQKKAIVGSWLVTVNNLDGPAQKAFLTFIEDGNLIGTTQGDVIPAHLITTAQHGTWSSQGGRAFTFTFLQIGYDPDGELIGILKVRANLTLSVSENELSGPFKFEITDPSGKVVASGDGGSLQATRIKVEPLP